MARTKRLRNIALCGMLGWAAALVAPGRVLAQENAPAPGVTPPSPPPASPPPPEAAPPSAPPQAPAGPSAQVPPGQWIYTQQYGWIWTPYAQSFTYAPPDGVGEPLMYVYYPAFGWRWVVAPWVWGIGPWPYFGVRGPRLFAWYRLGWWRTPAHWHFRSAPLRRDLVGHAQGVRPAPPRAERRFREPARHERR